MKVYGFRIPEWVLNNFSTSADDELDVQKKMMVLLGNLGGFFLTIIGAILYFSYNQNTTGYTAVVYLTLQFFFYSHYYKTRNFRLTVNLFSFSLFVLVIISHITLGGYQASGYVLVWVAASAIMVIIAEQRITAIIYLVLFFLTAILFTFLEDLIASQPNLAPKELSRILFIMNFVVGLVYMINNSFYFMNLLDQERSRADSLLLNILPKPIAIRLKNSPETIAEKYDEVTVVFIDIVDFTRKSHNQQPEELVAFLNSLFIEFDNLASQFDLEKIKTIGDAYMAVAGLPTFEKNHTETAIQFSLAIINLFKKPELQSQDVKVRIGIHTGPVVAGIIGKHKFSFDLWGDTVNIASRMESSGIENTIQITQSVKNKLNHPYHLKSRKVFIKGVGEMNTFLIQ